MGKKIDGENKSVHKFCKKKNKNTYIIENINETFIESTSFANFGLVQSVQEFDSLFTLQPPCKKNIFEHISRSVIIYKLASDWQILKKKKKNNNNHV